MRPTCAGAWLGNIGPSLILLVKHWNRFERALPLRFRAGESQLVVCSRTATQGC